MEKSSMGDRMKGYEKVTRTSLLRRTPVIIRLDGRAFHTYTSKMPRPFYKPLHDLMVESTKYLCEEIDTCMIGYTQSDEISLLLKDWTKFKTQAWFDGEVQKIVSTSAALVTAIFNDLAPRYLDLEYRRQRFGLFDSRVFNLPKEEVCNYFIWRQQDATRNSINSVGQAYFSQKQLNGMNTDQVQNMLITQKDINWNDFGTWAKRGTCVRIDINAETLPKLQAGEDVEFPNGRLVVDEDIPIFTKNRAYINDLMYAVQE
jgi:tRNA(His) 5'-end guanylyltransferase